MRYSPSRSVTQRMWLKHGRNRFDTTDALLLSLCTQANSTNSAIRVSRTRAAHWVASPQFNTPKESERFRFAFTPKITIRRSTHQILKKVYSFDFLSCIVKCSQFVSQRHHLNVYIIRMRSRCSIANKIFLVFFVVRFLLFRIYSVLNILLVFFSFSRSG